MDSIKNFPIVHGETAWKDSETVHTYILVLNEALYMEDNMYHSIVKPNKLIHYGTKVQNKPMSADPLSTITEDNEFYMELTINGTIMYAENHSTTDNELQT